MSKVNIDIKTDRTYEENVINMVPSGGQPSTSKDVYTFDLTNCWHEEDNGNYLFIDETLFNRILNRDFPCIGPAFINDGDDGDFIAVLLPELIKPFGNYYTIWFKRIGDTTIKTVYLFKDEESAIDYRDR